MSAREHHPFADRQSLHMKHLPNAFAEWRCGIDPGAFQAMIVSAGAREPRHDPVGKARPSCTQTVIDIGDAMSERPIEIPDFLSNTPRHEYAVGVHTVAP